MKDHKELDAFYTKSEIAKRFVDKINSIIPMSEFDLVVEPSAGNGRILDHLPINNRVGLDIHPEREDITKQDFFTYQPPSNPLLFEVPKVLTIGNPPFGRSSKLAVEFFKHAATFSQAIAFIVPRSWEKYSLHRRLPSDWDLYWHSILPDASFTFKDEDYPVRCTAQLWLHKSYKPELQSAHWESWNDKVKESDLGEIHQYYKEMGCYNEKS